MRVLVIGGLGFLGILIIPFLAQRHELRRRKRRPSRVHVQTKPADDLTDSLLIPSV